jgi:hypothetical protein
MAKKSRKTAARYSELSGSRRRKQRNRASPQAEAAAAPQVRAVAEAGPTRAPVAKSARSAKPEPKRSTLDYSYVGTDLKRIGMLTAAIAVIIIVLSFVLG